MRPNKADWTIVIIVLVISFVLAIVSFSIAESQEEVQFLSYPPVIFTGLMIFIMCLVFIPRRIRWAFFAVFDWLFTRSQ